jgi:hypothetical protein
MSKYWATRPAQSTTPTKPPAPAAPTSSLTGFHQHRQTLVARGEEGWLAELGRYLCDNPEHASPEMDVVAYWQDNHRIYPTLGRMALDFLPCQASSVPCERLFSASKQTATDRRARLGAQRFEELQLMKFAWRHGVINIAAWNSGEAEQVNVEEYRDLLVADVEQAKNEVDVYDLDLVYL